jgi:hypothetical protein
VILLQDGARFAQQRITVPFPVAEDAEAEPIEALRAPPERYGRRLDDPARVVDDLPVLRRIEGAFPFSFQR